MDISQTTEKPPRIYRIYRAFVVPALLYYGLIIFYVFTRPELDDVEYLWVTRLIIVFVVSPISIGLGWLIMKRVHGNVIGPALIIFVCLCNTEFVNSLLLPELQASINAIVLGVGFVLTFIIILSHFPTGRVFPVRFAKIFYAGIAALSLSTILLWLSDEWAYGFAMDGSPLPNRFYIPSLTTFQRQIEWGGTLVILLMIASIALLIFRYIHTNPIERKQLRWFVFCITITFLALVPYLVLPSAWSLDESTTKKVANIIVVLFMAAFPFAIGMGVLFYRLWDIDIIIRRTLVYGLLTVLLAFIFFGSVTLLQSLVTTVSGQDSPVVIVISTLVIAALFTPLRRRVQGYIDRRFYRQKYDAEKILAHFATTARDQVDLDTLAAELAGLINETLQPETVSLWLNTKIRKYEV